MRNLAPAIAVLLLALAASAQPADDDPQPSICEWTGTLTLAAVRTPRRDPARIAIVPLAGRHAVVSLVQDGLFHVRTVDDERAIEGTTREPIALVIASLQTFSGVATLAPGAAVDGVTVRRPGLRVDAIVGEGARLERMWLPCEALALSTEVAATSIGGTPPAGPRWASRTHRLRLHARPEPESPRLVLRLDDRAAHVFVERERNDAWVRVEARYPHATLSGWVADSDLLPTATR